MVIKGQLELPGLILNVVRASHGLEMKESCGWKVIEDLFHLMITSILSDKRLFIILIVM